MIPANVTPMPPACSLLGRSRSSTSAKAIVASGYGTDAVLAAPGAFGFQGRLQKPFEIEDLRKMVDGVLAGGPGGAG